MFPVKRGDNHNTDVKKFQSLIKKGGISIVVDGGFGKATTQAIANFNRKFNTSVGLTTVTEDDYDEMYFVTEGMSITHPQSIKSPSIVVVGSDDAKYMNQIIANKFDIKSLLKNKKFIYSIGAISILGIALFSYKQFARG